MCQVGPGLGLRMLLSEAEAEEGLRREQGEVKTRAGGVRVTPPASRPCGGRQP